jgi:hypothetical protein
VIATPVKAPLATSDARAGRQHFLLIKREDVSRSGEPLTAHEAADRLLTAGVWPLWAHTRCRNLVAAGDLVAIYLTGARNGHVVAAADVVEKLPWTATLARTYPLILSGTPQVALRLGCIRRLTVAVPIAPVRHQLSFIGSGPKWGVALMGGMRKVSETDFQILAGGQLSGLP